MSSLGKKNSRMMESFRLQKPSKIIKSNFSPNTAKATTNP